ncbi:hypothetical protein Scep_006138 [Stephania cephalantha]|uniref:Uncharacterized protein n=1 Tax=Stephania cephalantha TaxID=152367 RepID=A0AAP0K7J5_9MAGN
MRVSAFGPMTIVALIPLLKLQNQMNQRTQTTFIDEQNKQDKEEERCIPEERAVLLFSPKYPKEADKTSKMIPPPTHIAIYSNTPQLTN